METIKKILLPTDFSEVAQNAYRHALWLASQVQADIHLLHVVSPEYEGTDIPVLAAKVNKDKVDAAEIALQSFSEAGQAQVKGVVEYLPRITVETDLGAPVAVIRRVLREQEADLVVIGTRSKHNLLDKMLGSVTTGTLEFAPCPVMVIPQNAQLQAFKQAGFAVSSAKEANQYFDYASYTLSPLQFDLHLVKVFEETERLPNPEVEALEGLAAEQSGAVSVKAHPIVSQSVPKGLADFLEQQEIDLLIMMAPRHTILQRLFRQSRTKAMARLSQVPVLFLRPQ